MTITTKFLNDIISGHGYGVAPAAVEAITRELLAAREAVPVYQMRLLDGSAEQYTWAEVNHDEFNTPLKNPDEWEKRVLYTAPPAPAYPESLPCQVRLMPGLLFGKGVPTHIMLDALVRRAEY